MLCTVTGLTNSSYNLSYLSGFMIFIINKYFDYEYNIPAAEVVFFALFLLNIIKNGKVLKSLLIEEMKDKF